ncbi:hypothetical protein DM860_001984 [Cuscuta australis]|uniref:Uncharacterized protein n=1 Tax=Cuscuta australis TaxID=267555 RepID=A0A328DZV6_9ASTE|nr:hypothetical protein DM860_001984 [Cuscuta australis]
MCKCRSHGTFPLYNLQSSHLNIATTTKTCTDGRSTHCALLLIGAWILPQRSRIGRTLKRHPFSGLVDSEDERFAREYPCGLPPEFPIASPCSGIVHHLSGPNRVCHLYAIFVAVVIAVLQATFLPSPSKPT